MSEYEVLYKNVDDGTQWLSKGVFPGIKSAKATAYHTYLQEREYSNVVVKIVNRTDGSEYVVVVK